MIGAFICGVALSVLGAEVAMTRSGTSANRKAASRNGEIFYSDHGQLRTVKTNRKVNSSIDEYSKDVMYYYADELYPWAENAIVMPELYARNKTEPYSIYNAQADDLKVFILPYNPRSKLGEFCRKGDPLNTYNVLPFGWITLDMENKRPCYFDWNTVGNKVKMFLRYIDFDRMRELTTLERTKELGEISVDDYMNNLVFKETKNKYSVVNHGDYIDNVIKYHEAHKNDWKYDQSLV